MYTIAFVFFFFFYIKPHYLCLDRIYIRIKNFLHMIFDIMIMI